MREERQDPINFEIVNGEEENTALSTELADLADLTKGYIQNSKSKNTRKSYNSDWKDFCFWCSTKGLTAIPSTPETVAAYLADRATNAWVDGNGAEWMPLKPSSLSRRLTTISQAHKVADIPFDRGHSTIRETLKGIKNTHGVAQVRKKPILIEDLREMIQKIPTKKDDACDKKYLKGIRDRSILLIGFAGAFRRSEIVSINFEDVNFTRDGVMVALRRSKTDQTGEGREVAIPYGGNPLTCPVRSLRDWILASGISSGPLFRPINRHGHLAEKTLSDRAVADIIKSNPHIIDKSADYSGHSLRSGFITSAAVAGVPEYSIMQQSGHKRSDTLKKYIRLGNAWKENAASKVGL